VQKFAVMLGAGGGHWGPNKTARVVRNRNNGITVAELIDRVESEGGVVARVDRAGLLNVVTAVMGASSSCLRPNNRARVVRGSKTRFEK
jgi:hypothetical protein